MANNILFIGCGKVATGAALLLRKLNIRLHGARRDIAGLPAFMSKTAADVCNPSSLAFLQSTEADTIVYSIAAGGFDEQSYTQAYVTGLQNTLRALNLSTVKRLIFVSSTAVYHQNDGSLVDEHSATNPKQFNGKIMLEAERIAMQTGMATAVRFSGIYGPGRNRLIERVLNGHCTPEQTVSYTNRIHSQDCSAALAHLIMQPQLPPVIIATDSMPATSIEVESYIASQLNIPKQYADATGKTTRIAGSKRCSNQLLLNTGFKFSYPNYQQGYKKLIKDYGNKD